MFFCGEYRDRCAYEYSYEYLEREKRMILAVTAERMYRLDMGMYGLINGFVIS